MVEELLELDSILEDGIIGLIKYPVQETKLDSQNVCVKFFQTIL